MDDRMLERTETREVDEIQDEARRDLLPWAMIPIVLAGCVLTLLEVERTPLVPFFLGVLVLTLAGVVWQLQGKKHLAAWVMNLGGLGVISLCWYSFPESDTYHALFLPIIGAAITLRPLACILVAGLANLALVAGMFQIIPLRVTPSLLTINSGLLWITAFWMYIAQRPQNRLISWAWRGYEQARRHLSVARDRQLELKQALADLALANSQTVRLNEMLSAAQKALEEARRAKEEFVANVSHELRTPLNMIIGFSDMILESPQVYSSRLPAALLADVAAIKRNSQHLASLVDDVLSLAEADTGRLKLLQEWTSVQEIVREATEAVSALFEKKGLVLSVEVPDGLPPIYCDHTRIRQVMINLLSNAGRFTEVGGATVRASCEEQMIRISVSDTGPGIERDKIGGLFEPFQQADQTIRRRFGGTGLGLAISKRFIEMHDGKIWLESEVGAGSTVFFALPIYTTAPKDMPQRWFSPYQEYAPRTRRSLAPEICVKPCVVVWEQDTALFHLMDRYLEDLETTLVHTAEDAYQAIESNAAIALISNEATPNATPGALVDLPKTAFDIPVLSCWVPGRQKAVDEIGVQDYLVKPIRQSDILNAIDRVAPDARSILLADDDPDARQLFGRLLTSRGQDYDILDAEDGEETLALLRERLPDVLLLDLIMPNKDGFTVLEEKARDERIRGIPVVIVSGKDPQQSPIVSKQLTVTRQGGLSARDLALSVQSIVHALQPRFGAQEQPEMSAELPACE